MDHPTHAGDSWRNSSGSDMSGPTLVVFVGALLALLLAMVAMLVWQEGRKRSFDTAPEYVVDQLLAFIRARMPEDVRGRVGAEGVERIINWELRHLQRDGGEGAIAGGTEESVAYIVRQIDQYHGVAYPPDDVRAVLALEAEYLVTLGAVGAVVEEEGEREA